MKKSTYTVHAAKKEENVTISEKTFKNRLQNMIKLKDEILQNVDKYTVYISKENSKMGPVRSVSDIPVYNCPNCKFCARNCYDLRNDLWRPDAAALRSQNAAILEADPARYFSEIEDAAKDCTAFRWHVGGDIANYNYFENVVRIAKNCPGTQFLIFTKCFDIVNNYLDQNGGADAIPGNLHLLFSAWKRQPMINKYNLPVSLPIFDGDPVPNDAFLCPGNCNNCLETGAGCWTAKRGEMIVFNAH